MGKSAVANPAVRKVAALLASVDRPTAERLLAQLPKEKAREALAAARELGELSERERRETIAEFRRQASRPSVAAKNDDDQVELSISPEARRKSETVAPPSAFRFLEEASDDELLACVRGESPQIAAMALARLSPSRGGKLLQALDEPARNAAMERFATLDESDAELAREAETEIATHLRAKLAEMRRRDQRQGRLREILQAAGLDGQTALPSTPSGRTVVAARVATDSLDERSEPVETSTSTAASTFPPEELSRRFSRLFRLPPGAMAELCDRTPLPRLLAAMAGAEPEDVDAFAGMLPRGEAKAFHARLRERLPISLAEIDAAQAELLALAEQLSEEGLL